VRIGGDEFCVILPAVQNDTDLQIIADRMVEAFRMPFKISGHDVYSAASIGTLLTPEDGTTSEQLSRHADKALYMAKARGRNCAVRFDNLMLLRSHRNPIYTVTAGIFNNRPGFRPA
jgi:diguanylate cyclase (GGDEF)-like protein